MRSASSSATTATGKLAEVRGEPRDEHDAAAAEDERAPMPGAVAGVERDRLREAIVHGTRS